LSFRRTNHFFPHPPNTYKTNPNADPVLLATLQRRRHPAHQAGAFRRRGGSGGGGGGGGQGGEAARDGVIERGVGRGVDRSVLIVSGCCYHFLNAHGASALHKPLFNVHSVCVHCVNVRVFWLAGGRPHAATQQSQRRIRRSNPQHTPASSQSVNAYISHHLIYPLLSEHRIEEARLSPVSPTLRPAPASQLARYLNSVSDADALTASPGGAVQPADAWQQQCSSSSNRRSGTLHDLTRQHQRLHLRQQHLRISNGPTILLRSRARGAVACAGRVARDPQRCAQGTAGRQVPQSRGHRQGALQNGDVTQ